MSERTPIQKRVKRGITGISIGVALAIGSGQGIGSISTSPLSEGVTSSFSDTGSSTGPFTQADCDDLFSKKETIGDTALATSACVDVGNRSTEDTNISEQLNATPIVIFESNCVLPETIGTGNPTSGYMDVGNTSSLIDCPIPTPTSGLGGSDTSGVISIQ